MNHHNVDDCAAYLDQIVYLIDNELDEADIVAVRLHLEGCGPCLARYDVQVAMKSLVARTCGEPAPSGLMERVRLQIQQIAVTIRDETAG